jgi:hypothetical protein
MSRSVRGLISASPKWGIVAVLEMFAMVPVNVNNVLVLSILYLATIARLPLAKLFIASWEARHGQEFGR